MKRTLTVADSDWKDTQPSSVIYQPINEERRMIRAGICAYATAGVVATAYLIAELCGIESRSLDLFGSLGTPIISTVPAYAIARIAQD